MRIGLLLSDIAIFLIGLFGLIGVMVFFALRDWIMIVQTPAHFSHLASGLFLLAMTFAFLLPSVNQGVLRKTLTWWLRVPFVLVAAFWLFATQSLVQAAIARGDLPALPDQMTAYFPIAAIAIAVLFALFIFPVGLAYAEPRRERALAHPVMALSDAPAVAPVSAYAMADAAAPPSRPVHGLAAPAGDKMTWRSHLVSLPVTAFVIWTMGTFRTSSTTINPTLEIALAPYLWFGVGAIGALFALMFLLSLMLEPTYRPPLRRKPALAILVLPVMFGLCWLLWLGATQNGLPTAWNLLTENPDGAITYTVDDIITSRKLRGCVALSTETGATFINCGMGRDFIDQLAEGDRIEIVGELSAVGHTFDRGRILP